ncbi:MAG: transcriptional repressor LexA [Candidatus Aminicenantes bacterium]|nr:transcriptional repressor LexA [Candidatus Aminicenantes bacterium]
MVNKFRRTLTRRQAKVLEALKTFWQEHGYPPTIRELGRLVGIASPSAVLKHLRSLERKGYLDREAGELQPVFPSLSFSRSLRIPLVGLVPAGSPREVFDDLGETIDIPDWFLGRRQGQVFGLRVEGRSMIDAYINEGDLVLIEKTDQALPGEMIVAQLEDGSITLKRLKIEGDRILLVPENPEFAPLEVREFRVIGRVVGLLRQY